MNRKNFIKTTAVYTAGCLCMGSLMTGCSSPYYVARSTYAGNRISIAKSEFIEIKNDVQKQRKYVLIKNEKLEFPICLYRLEDASYSALYLKCTHRGCEVQPQSDHLLCPCHQSEFDLQGKVLSPPAEANLKSFNVTSDDNNIYIEL